MPVVWPSNTPDSISTISSSRRCVTWREVPGLRRSRSCWMSASDSSSPGGQPSTTQPMAGPWLSPNEVTQNNLPRVLPDMKTPVSTRREEGRVYTRSSAKATSRCRRAATRRRRQLPARDATPSRREPARRPRARPTGSSASSRCLPRACHPPRSWYGKAQLRLAFGSTGLAGCVGCAPSSGNNAGSLSRLGRRRASVPVCEPKGRGGGRRARKTRACANKAGLICGGPADPPPR